MEVSTARGPFVCGWLGLPVVSSATVSAETGRKAANWSPTERVKSVGYRSTSLPGAGKTPTSTTTYPAWFRSNLNILLTCSGGIKTAPIE